MLIKQSLGFHESSHNEIYFLHVNSVEIRKKWSDASAAATIKRQISRKHATEIFIGYTRNDDLVGALSNLLLSFL